MENKQQIKFIERQVKSVLTIDEKSHNGFTYTRGIIDEILRQQIPLIKDRNLFVTLGYTGENLTEQESDKLEGIVTKVDLTEDNKLIYTIAFLERVANLYLSMHIPMSVEIPIKGKIIDGKYLTEVETMNYIDLVFDNPEETIEKIKKAVDYIKELTLNLEVK